MGFVIKGLTNSFSIGNIWFMVFGVEGTLNSSVVGERISTSFKHFASYEMIKVCMISQKL
jgi:hypothetical protein